ncbi:hypothetical protein CR513_15334, partial [Mucuna pruriens]
MDMIRSILNYSTIPLSLWMHALKIIVIPIKIVPTTPYELWMRRKPKVKVYNPHEKKLDAITISDFFINYLEKFKYKFYCPNHKK